MSIQTVDRPKQTPQPARQVEPPPLNSGDRLSRAEFERRYEAHPEIKKAELPELQERLEDLEDTLSGFDSAIPVDTQLGQFLSTIAALMDEHNLSEQQIAPHEQIESEELICISVTMKGVGRLEQIRSFCQSLQQLDRVVRIEKFHLVNNDQYSGQVHMETEAIIYRRKPANKS